MAKSGLKSVTGGCVVFCDIYGTPLRICSNSSRFIIQQNVISSAGGKAVKAAVSEKQKQKT